jgi:hypothetical protein
MPRKRKQRYTAEGFLPSSNPEQARWMRELGKSSATQRHTPKPRKGTRRERERQAIRDQQKNQEH